MIPRFNALFASGLRSAFNADGWTLVAPFGNYPFTTPEGETFVQVFTEEGAAEMVSTFNGLWSRLARVVGPVFGKHACPVWLGHPDFGEAVWKERRQLGTVDGLRVGAAGLEARLALNAEGERIREEGLHVFPSVAVECETEPGTKRIHPKLLWSIGLWKKPNIPKVESIATINAAGDGDKNDRIDGTDDFQNGQKPEGQTQTEQQTENDTMKIDPHLKKLLMALGVMSEDAGDDMEETAFNAAFEKGMAALNTYKQAAADAEAAKVKAEKEKADADKEKADAMTATNAARTTIADLRKARAEFAVAALVASGHVTEADKAATITSLNAEDFDTKHAAILDKGPVVKTGGLNLGKAKAAIASAAEARTTINAWTEKYMQDHKADYQTAWNAAEKADDLKEAFKVIKPKA